MDYNLSAFSKFNYNNALALQTQPLQNNSAVKNPVEPVEKPKTELKTDVFVNSKKEKIKRIGKFALLAAGLAAIGFITALKVKTKGMEKEVTALYDKMCTEAQEQADRLGINFEKPKLIFKKMEHEMGGYSCNTNTIIFNRKLLSKKNFSFADFNSLYKTDVISDTGKQIVLCDTFTLAKSKKGSGRIPSDNEYMLVMKQTLGHELTHARQAQIALSAENALDLIVETIKKRPNAPKLTDEEIIETLKKTSPFVFSYKPKKLIPIDTQFAVNCPSKATLVYTPKTMIESLFNYTSAQKDKYGYYVNRAEVEARMTESKVANDALKDFCEKHKISNETLVDFQGETTSQKALEELQKTMSEAEIDDLRAYINISRASNHNVNQIFKSILNID